jgi:Tol biopolymer transport system component
LMDLLRGTSTRFIFEGDEDFSPLWSPDGTWLAWSSGSGPQGSLWDYTLHRRRIGGTKDEAWPLEPGGQGVLMDLSSDGRFLLYFDGIATTGAGLWTLPLFGERTPQPFLKSMSAAHARISPDSRWAAYTSDASGRPEVYVESFPAPNGARQISIDGGTQPRWRRDGKELFFVAADGKLMAVSIRGDAGLEIGAPAALFDARIGTPSGSLGAIARQQYDVSADGQRFLINRTSSEPSPITVVLNWTAGLKF